MREKMSVSLSILSLKKKIMHTSICSQYGVAKMEPKCYLFYEVFFTIIKAYICSAIFIIQTLCKCKTHDVIHFAIMTAAILLFLKAGVNIFGQEGWAGEDLPRTCHGSDFSVTS